MPFLHCKIFWYPRTLRFYLEKSKIFLFKKTAKYFDTPRGTIFPGENRFRNAPKFVLNFVQILEFCNNFQSLPVCFLGAFNKGKIAYKTGRAVRASGLPAANAGAAQKVYIKHIYRGFLDVVKLSACPFLWYTNKSRFLRLQGVAFLVAWKDYRATTKSPS